MTSRPDMRAVRELTAKVADLTRQVKAQGRARNLGNSAIDAGALVVTNDDGEVALSIGTNDDGTTTVDYVAGPTPGTPSAPIVTPVVGALVVTWDGKLITEEGEQGAPGDFLNVGVYITQAPDEDETPAFDLDTAALAGVITNPGGGSKTFGLDYGRYEVRLVALSRAGQYSEPSEPGTGDVERIIDDPDISAAMTELDETLEEAREDLDESALRITAAEALIAAAQSDIVRASRLFTSSPVQPTVADGADRIDGSWWVQTDAAGAQAGTWQWDGTAWIARPLSPTVIPLLDAGKITTGTLDADRVTSNALAAQLAQIMQLDVAKLVASSATIDEAVALRLFADIFTAKKITAAEADVASLRAAVLIAGAIQTDMLAAGSITVDKLRVGDPQNLIPDPDYATGDAVWQSLDAGPGSGWSPDYLVGSAAATVKLTPRPGALPTMTLYGYRHRAPYLLQVRPGEAYRVTIPILMTTGFGNATSVQLRAYFYDTSKTSLSTNDNVQVGQATSTTMPSAKTWGTVSGIVTVPAGAVYMTVRPTVYYPANTPATNPTNAWHFGPVTCYRAMDTSLVVNGAISADALAADAITGKTITGGTVIGSVVRMNGTGGASGYDIILDGDGAGSYLGFGVPSFTVAGTIRANGEDGQATPELVLRSPGTAAYPGRAALRVQSATTSADPGTIAIKGAIVGDGGRSVVMRSDAGANVECASSGNLWLRAGNKDGLTVYPDQAVRAWGTYSATTTASANMYIDSAGYLKRSTSVGEAKLSIEPVSDDQLDALLDIEPVTWIDRADAERMAEYESLMLREDLTEEEQEYADHLLSMTGPLLRQTGVTVEQLEAVGATTWVTYDEQTKRTKTASGVAYDRMAPALIKIVRRQRDQIAALEARLDALEARP